jgi:hypothetical protein
MGLTREKPNFRAVFSMLFLLGLVGKTLQPPLPPGLGGASEIVPGGQI